MRQVSFNLNISVPPLRALPYPGLVPLPDGKGDPHYCQRRETTLRSSAHQSSHGRERRKDLLSLIRNSASGAENSEKETTLRISKNRSRADRLSFREESRSLRALNRRGLDGKSREKVTHAAPGGGGLGGRS